jgi:hypothetical protein
MSALDITLVDAVYVVPAVRPPGFEYQGVVLNVQLNSSLGFGDSNLTSAPPPPLAHRPECELPIKTYYSLLYCTWPSDTSIFIAVLLDLIEFCVVGPTALATRQNW